MHNITSMQYTLVQLEILIIMPYYHPKGTTISMYGDLQYLIKINYHPADCAISVAPIFSGVVDMDMGGRRTYDLCGTCKRTMDNEVPGIMY